MKQDSVERNGMVVARNLLAKTAQRTGQRARKRLRSPSRLYRLRAFLDSASAQNSRSYFACMRELSSTNSE